MIRPFVIWLESHNHPVEKMLREVDLYWVLQNRGDEFIPMTSALRLIRNMVEKEGPDLPLRVVEDDNCFRPVRDLLLPGARTVEGALTAAIGAVPIHFSHFEMSARHESSGNLQIRGIVHTGYGTWDLDDIHEAQLYAIAIIKRICTECDRRELNVFERVELTRHSRGLKHLEKARFGKVVGRSGSHFVVSVRHKIAGGTYGPRWFSAMPIQLERYEVPKNDLVSTCLAVGERMDGVVTLKRILAALGKSLRTLQRWMDEPEDIVALIFYNKEQIKCGKRIYNWSRSAERTGASYIIESLQLGEARRRWAAFRNRQRRHARRSGLEKLDEITHW